MKDENLNISGYSWSHFISVVAGVYLITGFFSLGETYNGLWVRFLTPFTNMIDSGESYFWLAHLYYMTLAACLLGYGLSPSFAKPLMSLKEKTKNLSTRNIIIGLVCLFVAVVAVSKLGNSFVLQGYPITDDEYAAEFGGQVFASGHVKVPVPDWFKAYPERFLLQRDGFYTAFDWPGVQVIWALAVITGLGSIVFSILAALPYIAVAIIIGIKFGKHWGAVSALLFVFSPMAAALTVTTHAHLASRAFLSLAILFYFLTTRKERAVYWGAAGFFAGCSFFHRPFETVFLILPLIFDVLYRLIKKEMTVKSLVFLSVGVSIPLLAFGLLNNALTGNPLLPGRFAESEIKPRKQTDFLAAFKSIEIFWNRFGANTNYNLMMLMVWFLGPVGVVFAVFGVKFDRFTKILALCVLSHLFLGLFHDNHGLHMVGPIHYSEDVAFLTIIAAHGLYFIVQRIKSTGFVDIKTFASILVFYLVFGMGTFNAWQMKALNEQSHIQSEVYDWIDNQGLHNAIVLAPRFYEIWSISGIPAKYATTGCYVFEWRMTKPDYSDDVLILRDVKSEIPKLRKAFPDRTLYRMTITKRPEGLRMLKL
ncbi:MAG: glycosyltransferase family 39 protein [Candidatus Krumholzibacteriota bacterium]|nr:glycosyltransferase family 39 protein [Candidatus Krumholzibacteriota bacterium]